MKKILFMLFLAITITFTGKAQTSSYYYFQGEKQPLTVDNESYTVVSVNNSPTTFSSVGSLQRNYTMAIRHGNHSMVAQQNDVDDNSIVLPNFVTEQGDTLPMTPYLNVKLKKSEDRTLLQEYAIEYSLEIIEELLPMENWFHVAVTPSTPLNTLDIANLMVESGDFESATPEFVDFMTYSVSNDEYVGEQWYLYSDVTSNHANVSEAWNYTQGEGTFIALVDCGIKSLYDFNPLYKVYNTVANDPNYYSSDATTYGQHGTGCASVIASKRNNGWGLAGIAPKTHLISVTIDSQPIEIENGEYSTHSDTVKADYVTLSRITRGITWAALYGHAEIISCSWAFLAKQDLLQEALQTALKQGRNGLGCVIVFAAGNDFSNNIEKPIPMSFLDDDIIVVGACGKNKPRCDFSCYGERLDLVAPGEEIIVAESDDKTPLWENYSVVKGTSLSCPMVAATAALILSLDYSLTSTEVKRIICQSTNKSSAKYPHTKEYGTWSETVGYGLLDTYGAVKTTLQQNKDY